MKECKKSKILEAVEKIIEEKRFHEVLVDDIAKLAGVGKGTIYRYFSSKEELFLQLALKGFTTIGKEMDMISREDIPFRGKLEKLTDKFTKFIEKRKSIMKTMQDMERRVSYLEDDQRSIIDDAKRGVRDKISLIFEEGIRENLLTLNITAKQYAEFWIHTLVGLSHWDSNIAPIDHSIIINQHLRG